MCDPISIASAALAVGSTVANQMAAGEVDDARADAMAAERQRQQRLDKEAGALNLQSQDRYQNFEGQQDERGQQLAEFLKERTAQEPQSGMAMPESQSAITVQEEGNQRATARDFTNQQAEGLARLRSFGDLLGGIGREQSLDAAQIGQLGSFKQGSQGVLPLELQAAQSAGSGWRTFGDILGAGSQVGMAAGAAGQGPGWGELFGGSQPVASGPPRQIFPQTGTQTAARPANAVRLPALY